MLNLVLKQEEKVILNKQEIATERFNQNIEDLKTQSDLYIKYLNTDVGFSLTKADICAYNKEGEKNGILL